MINLNNVSRIYGEGPSAVFAVSELTTTIDAGSFVTVVGASGSGKSTLLHLIGALDRPSSGTVVIDNTDLFGLGDNARTLFRREKIGFVFQFFNLLPTLSALENVALPAALKGRGRKRSENRARELLERVGLGARAKHKPDELSGGEMQRVAIARALMMDPPVVLADEPTGNLDSATGKTILEMLRGAVTDRRTVVLVTHDPAIAEQGDRVLTMADGKMVSDTPGATKGSGHRSPASV
jgi:putative ABC transport system ATP-binding protein